MFVDEVTIHVKGGDGGRGAVSFRREKYVPRGGPDGGNGGHGGSVILVVETRLHTLLDLQIHSRNRATRGGHGGGSHRAGRDGADLTIPVPAGTLITDADSGESLVDLVEPGQTFVAARGGQGGRGNASFATSTNRAPRFAQPGLPGEERRLKLELKVLADVGIIGFPNAGKSTFITSVTESMSKVAPYPFTTLNPHLGVIQREDYTRLVLADLPGLIQGAHLGHGLGIRFLKHVQRTRLLLHIVDLSPDSGRNPLEDWKAIDEELSAFDPRLKERKQIVVGNKIDLPGTEARRKSLAAFCRRRKLPFFAISAYTGQGLEALTAAVFEAAESLRTEEVAADA